jgi:hypothetical protein
MSRPADREKTQDEQPVRVQRGVDARRSESRGVVTRSRGRLKIRESQQEEGDSDEDESKEIDTSR